MDKSERENKPHQLLIKLTRSPIGSPQRIRLVLLGLGLRRRLQTVQRPDSQQVRGLLNKVRHLVEVTDQ